MDSNKAWVLVLGVLLIFGLTAFGMVWVIRETIQQTVQPVSAVTGNLGTRVAEVLNPTPTILPNPATIIQGIRSLARLETIQYSVEKVITAETGQGMFSFLFGDRLIFVAHGIVIAGVDMAKIGPNDLWTEGNVLYVRLPEPEIFVATLDNEKSYVFDRDSGVLNRGQQNLESDARRAAEDEIEKAAIEDGILTYARQNGESYLYRLLLRLGYSDVVFVDSPTQGTPVPGTATPQLLTP